MRFLITRTSECDDDVPPCPEAQRGEYDAFTYYTFKTIGEAKFRYPDLDFERTGDGVRSPRGRRSAWFVDINTLDELVALHERYGQLVIERDWRNHEQIAIDIYDTYRE